MGFLLISVGAPHIFICLLYTNNIFCIPYGIPS